MFSHSLFEALFLNWVITVPKMCLIPSEQAGGVLSTRIFIPLRCHTTIGFFGAVGVAAACLIEGSVLEVAIEHPSEEFTVETGLHTVSW